MEESNVEANKLSPIEEYLRDMEANVNTVRNEEESGEVAGGSRDDVISAETVRGIMGNLNAQMTGLSKKKPLQVLR
ncbi:UNVERIFIED_CONTAM: hypothetical protein RMT77_011046 [Armadillidium vulgare]